MDTCSYANVVHDNIFVSNLERAFRDSLHIQDCQSEGNDICNVGEEKLCGGTQAAQNEGNDIFNVGVENLCGGIQDAQNEGGDICSVGKENLCGVKEEETKQNMMCLRKSSTFPIPMMLTSSSSDKVAETSVTSECPAHQTYSRSVSLPAPVKLISAMKGSRARNGGSHMKLNVKWASDVYDPIPTLVSHTVQNKKPQKTRKKKNEKKNGKKSQKGNSSRGGGNKDKQLRKMGGTSGLSNKSMDYCDKVIGASADFEAFGVLSQDAYCGTSFLKKSVTEVHYSVAEAL